MLIFAIIVDVVLVRSPLRFPAFTQKYKSMYQEEIHEYKHSKRFGDPARR